MPPELLPYIPVIALCISVLALFVGGANLGWSIYKEIGLRARLRVRFGLKAIYHSTFPEPVSRFVLSVTNHGPGKVRITMINLRKVSLWLRIVRKTEHAVLMHDYEHPLGGQLPYDLEVGHGMDLSFPLENEFIKGGLREIGIGDSFGRVHWCRSRDMKEARKALKNRNEKKKNGA